MPIVNLGHPVIKAFTFFLLGFLSIPTSKKATCAADIGDLRLGFIKSAPSGFGHVYSGISEACFVCGFHFGRKLIESSLVALLRSWPEPALARWSVTNVGFDSQPTQLAFWRADFFGRLQPLALKKTRRDLATYEAPKLFGKDENQLQSFLSKDARLRQISL